MKYYLDCEFNGYRGELISLALVREDGPEIYLAWPKNDCIPWVTENVLPRICAAGTSPHIHRIGGWSGLIETFLRGDRRPEVIADWPDDIRYFCEVIITGPGQVIDIPCLECRVSRVDAYPTDLPGAVQHNALWDARALRHKLMGGNKEYFCPILHRCPHWLDRCRELGCQHPDAIEMRAMGPPAPEAYKWRYQRKEGWGDIWRQTNEDPRRPGFFESPDDWTVEDLLENA